MFTGTERFRILRQLGRGGTGVVYLAHDQQRGIDVALKTLHQDSPYGILRLKNEFRGLAELSHPNLVDLHDLHHDNNTWFFTMEYVDGVDLMEWVRPYNQNTDDFELDLLVYAARLNSLQQDCLRSIRQASSSGYQPSNLSFSEMVEWSSRFQSRDPCRPSGHSRGSRLQWYSRIGPGTKRRTRPVPASDWYSFGCVLFQALTGQLLPWQAPSSRSAETSTRWAGAQYNRCRYLKTWTHSVRHCYAETRRLVQTRKRSLNA